MKITRKYYGLLLLTLFAYPLEAQKKGYVEGYIIQWNGDTISGLVKDRSTGTFTDLYSKIRFKSPQSLLRKKYGPDEIHGYGYGKYMYESLPLREESEFFRFRYYLDDRNGRVFLRVVARYEPLTWYHWEYIDAESNYIDYIPLLHKQYSPEMVRVTQGILGLKRNRLTEYFRDCPELVRALDRKQVNGPEEVYNFYILHCLDQKLEGKWMMWQVIQDGNDVSAEHNPQAERYIIFYEDGAFESGGRPYGLNTGRYEYSPEDGILYLISDAGPEDDSRWKVTIESDTMTWNGLGSEWANRFRITHRRAPR